MSQTPDDLALPEQEAGLAFRAEMWTTNFILGYWRHVLAVIVVGLLCILIYGQYTNTVRRQQRAQTSEVAEEWAKLPAQAIPGQLTPEDEAGLKAVADGLMVIGADSGRTAAAEAYLKAAELYRMLGETDSQRSAMEKAVPYAKGALLYAAKSGIANLDLEKGDSEAAIAAYRELMKSSEPFLAQQAAINLGLAYEYLGRIGDARGLYTEFLTTWPESPQLQAVQDRMDRLSGREDEAPPAPTPAPMDEAPVDEAPVDEAPVDEAPVDEAPVDEGAPE